MKYSSERAVQILISLLKQHSIKKIIASPGATNITFIASAMHDPWFEIYSSVDERSAAYMACGLAEESGEPVVISCTGATASRNYMPGLTEAYYRKLPVLAVTASQNYDKIGHLSPQLLDRSNIPNDVARKSFTVKAVRDQDDEWADTIAINNAILELNRHGGGPVHINFQTTYSRDYSIDEIVPVQKIDRIYLSNKIWPDFPKGKIGIFIGSHHRMTDELTKAIDNFCAQHDAVVFCDHTSNFYGKYRVNMSLPFEQAQYDSPLRNLRLLIHVGEISGDYPSMSIHPSEVWRISEDGELRDSYRKLKYVFEMPEIEFFRHYTTEEVNFNEDFLEACKAEYEDVRAGIQEIPFSNGWIASKTAHRIPVGSIVHLGILNTLRNWNYFPFQNGVRSNSNVGGFGIDGIVSTLLGASLTDKDSLYFAILGDLAFFYDLNAIGNRHLSSNIRILLINNGKGTEFRNYNHPGAAFGEESDKFIAAAKHYGDKSKSLVKHLSEDLGFEYLSANNKEEYLSKVDRFTTSEHLSKPIIFEVFTDSEDESNALHIIQHSKKNLLGSAKGIVKNVIGDKGVNKLKSMLGKG